MMHLERLVFKMRPFIKEELEYSSVFRTLVHLFVIPFVLFIAVSLVDKQWTIVAIVIYVTVVALLQIARVKIIPTVENIYRRDVFFEMLSFVSVILMVGALSLALLIIGA